MITCRLRLMVLSARALAMDTEKASIARPTPKRMAFMIKMNIENLSESPIGYAGLKGHALGRGELGHGDELIAHLLELRDQHPRGFQ